MSTSQHSSVAAMSTPLKVGIVGYGFAGRTFHAPLIAGVPGLELVGIASSAPARVRADWPEVPVSDSPEALLARPDINLVVIATPNATHYPLASRALAAGKHVVVDKPFTVTLEEARRLDREAQRAGRVLSVFHNRRWDADFLTLSEVLAGGELGRLAHFESHFDRYRPDVRGRWREQDVAGAGLWFDLGSHLLDQALRLFGLPEAISLDLAAQRQGAEVDDWFHALLRYGGMRVVLHGSALVPVPAARFTVHGSLGSFVKQGLDPQEDMLKAGARPPAAGWGVDSEPARVTVWSEGEARTHPVAGRPGDYPAYYVALRDAILGAAPNPVPAAEAIQVMALIELGRRSARERRELALMPADLAA